MLWWCADQLVRVSQLRKSESKLAHRRDAFALSDGRLGSLEVAADIVRPDEVDHRDAVEVDFPYLLAVVAEETEDRGRELYNRSRSRRHSRVLEADARGVEPV